MGSRCSRLLSFMNGRGAPMTQVCVRMHLAGHSSNETRRESCVGIEILDGLHRLSVGALEVWHDDICLRLPRHRQDSETKVSALRVRVLIDCCSALRARASKCTDTTPTTCSANLWLYIGVDAVQIDFLHGDVTALAWEDAGMDFTVFEHSYSPHISWSQKHFPSYESLYHSQTWCLRTQRVSMTR